MKRLLQQYLTEQAERSPDAIAVVLKEQRLTYSQLEAASNQFARLLRRAGCRTQDRVCIVVEKSPEAIVAILGALKAGCIYVPVDVTNPQARVAKIVAASEPRCIVADAKSEDKIRTLPRELVPTVVWVGRQPALANANVAEFLAAEGDTYSDQPLSCDNGPDSPAHILFTSGSTGTPKGVVIKHANVTAFVEWALEYFGARPGDRISCHPPLHFDLSGFDIYGAFAAGAELHLVPPDTSLMPHELAEFIRRSELKQWFSVPAVLNYLARFQVKLDFPALNRVLWCGEALPVPTLVYWMKQLPHASFTNLYGPTETTIASSYYTVPSCPTDERASIPIGTPCAGEQLFVLDENLCPAAVDEIADLYIAGAGLSPGYWRDPEKTAAVFLQHPITGERIYRTGDLAKIGRDGLVYFVGRADSQIKHRGYRIELGEIESALNALGWFSECAVVSIETSGFEGTTICCAYVPSGQGSDDPLEIRAELARSVPAYMLPSKWKSFPVLPKNANGKTDRPALREYFRAASMGHDQGAVAA